jgi:6-phosphogluconolactonase (cycloisomerase 2 family)
MRRTLFSLIAAAITCGVTTHSTGARDKNSEDDRDDQHEHGSARNVLYVTSNNPTPRQNSVLAFRRSGKDGRLTSIGNFLTRGTGVYNADERLGPDDSDQEIVASPDGRRLFAVNSGSDTIAVFNIDRDGRLTHVHGSPFPSGGVQPVSLGLAGQQLYVVNKGDREPGQTGGSSPNYTGFCVGGEGRLTPIPGSTITVRAGSHPTQALISPNGRLLFGIDLFNYPFTPPPGFPPFVPPFASALESFRILSNGRLAQGANTPQPSPLPPPAPPFVLGLQVHPTKPLLYAGFVIGGAMGTFKYDAAGTLTFLNSTPISGQGICWIHVNTKGTHAYSSNSTDDSISVFSLANPSQPVEIQKVDLKGPRELLGGPAPVIFTTTPFQLSLDPTGQFLYILNHETTVNDTYPQGNAVHILRVGRDGKLTETSESPLILPQSAVPARAHPKGIVVL